MRAKIQKWGNSLALRIPKGLTEMLGVKDGSEVTLEIRGGELMIKPVRRSRYTLDELVAGITDENHHDEVDTGPSVGNEAW